MKDKIQYEVKSVSPAKFYRMKLSGTLRIGSLFDDVNWVIHPTYDCFEHSGYVYTAERANTQNFRMVFKRYRKDVCHRHHLTVFSTK